MSDFCSWFIFSKGNVMKLEEIRSIAESWGVHPSKLSKTQSVKAIQTEEGHSCCFAAACSGDATKSAVVGADRFDATMKGALS